VIKRLAAALRVTASESSLSSGLGRWRQLVSDLVDSLLVLPWPGSLCSGPLVSGAYQETLPAGALYPDTETWYTSSAKTQVLLRTTYTRDVNQNVTQILWQVYDLSGNLALTVTDAITYSGSYVASRTRTVV
jgi:hypothetical protein